MQSPDVDLEAHEFYDCVCMCVCVYVACYPMRSSLPTSFTPHAVLIRTCLPRSFALPSSSCLQQQQTITTRTMNLTRKRQTSLTFLSECVHAILQCKSDDDKRIWGTQPFAQPDHIGTTTRICVERTISCAGGHADRGPRCELSS